MALQTENTKIDNLEELSDDEEILEVYKKQFENDPTVKKHLGEGHHLSMIQLQNDEDKTSKDNSIKMPSETYEPTRIAHSVGAACSCGGLFELNQRDDKNTEISFKQESEVKYESPKSESYGKNQSETYGQSSSNNSNNYDRRQ